MIQLIVVIALVGLLVWAITQFVPMPQKFQQLIVVVAIVAVVLYVLSAFGLLTGFALTAPHGRVRLP